ncbi:hypothetical protein [Pseudomonas brenneri]|uniref:hypothetical protein n=1 Tax=Pseudomonas brenneri TaxID=129817 RepID=UPI003B9EA64D
MGDRNTQENFAKETHGAGPKQNQSRQGRMAIAETIFLLLLLVSIVGWGCVQLYFQFSPDAALWWKGTSEAYRTDRSYIIYWSRLIPLFIAAVSSIKLIVQGDSVQRISFGASFAAAFLFHCVVLFTTDLEHIVKGLAIGG